MNRQEVTNHVVLDLDAELNSDHVEMWLVARAVRQYLPDASPDEVHEIATIVIRKLLENGDVLGDLTDKGFVVWEEQESKFSDLVHQWIELARDPEIGELGWIIRPVVPKVV